MLMCILDFALRVGRRRRRRNKQLCVGNGLPGISRSTRVCFVNNE